MTYRGLRYWLCSIVEAVAAADADGSEHPSRLRWLLEPRLRDAVFQNGKQLLVNVQTKQGSIFLGLLHP